MISKPFLFLFDFICYDCRQFNPQLTHIHVVNGCAFYTCHDGICKHKNHRSCVRMSKDFLIYLLSYTLRRQIQQKHKQYNVKRMIPNVLRGVEHTARVACLAARNKYCCGPLPLPTALFLHITATPEDLEGD